MACDSIVVDDTTYGIDENPSTLGGRVGFRLGDVDPFSNVPVQLSTPEDMESKYHSYGSYDGKSCFVYPRSGLREVIDAILPCAQLKYEDGEVHAITWLRPGDSVDADETMFEGVFTDVSLAYDWIDAGRRFSRPVGVVGKVSHEVF